MATYYVWSGATGSGTGADWTNAFTTMETADGSLTNADICYVAHDHVELGTVAKTLTFPNTPGLRVICVDRTTGDLVTTHSAQIGIGSANVALFVNGCAYFYGIEWVASNTSNASCDLNFGNNTSVNSVQIHERCYLWNRSANVGAEIIFGATSSANSDDQYFELRDCELRVTATATELTIRNSRVVIHNLSLNSFSAIPAELFANSTGQTYILQVYDSDLSFANTLQRVSTTGTPTVAEFYRCILKSTYSIYASNPTTLASAETYLIDCTTDAPADIPFLYANGNGVLLLDSAIYYTGTPSGVSWLITTTSNCSRENPFYTPWIEWLDPPTTSITPRFEVLRNLSSSAWNDDQISAEFRITGTATAPRAVIYTDAPARNVAGTAQATGAGNSEWTGASGSAWSGKLDSGAAVTHDGGGSLTGRVVVTTQVVSLRVDPYIRT